MTAQQIKDMAANLGFDLCKITGAEPSQHAQFFESWLADGKAGTMEWLSRNKERRASPQTVLPRAQSLVVVGLNYWQPEPESAVGKAGGVGKIARYAWGLDYHEVMLPKLEQMAGELTVSGAESRIYVDTGPVLEKPLAERSGLGWQGKSTMLLSTRFGPWLFLGEIITTLALEPDPPAMDHCGKCSRCIDLCPTGAITGPYHMDARRCISYLTIELKGSIPLELRTLIGGHIYGCDVCLEVCPWNRFAKTTREIKFTPLPGVLLSLGELLALDNQRFKTVFAGSPILRIKRRGLLRNVCVALGNMGGEGDLQILRVAAQDTEPLIQEHAMWAIQQIERRMASN